MVQAARVERLPCHIGEAPAFCARPPAERLRAASARCAISNQPVRYLSCVQDWQQLPTTCKVVLVKAPAHPFSAGERIKVDWKKTKPKFTTVAPPHVQPGEKFQALVPAPLCVSFAPPALDLPPHFISRDLFVSDYARVRLFSFAAWMEPPGRRAVRRSTRKRSTT